MIRFAPVPFQTRRLGQISQLTSGITGNLARQIVSEAEPAMRRVVRDERNRLAEAIIGGIPFLAVGAIGYTATRYLVPDGQNTAKAVGYMGSAAAAAVGAWWSLHRMTEAPSEGEAPATPSGTPPQIVQQAAAELIQAAEPRVRQLVAEERQRLADATQAGLPILAGGAAAFLATMFLVGDKNRALKALGYSASVLIMATGVWVTAEKTKEAAA
jgi:hypothetical protein